MERHVSPKSGKWEKTAIEKVRETKRGMTQSRAGAWSISTVTWGGRDALSVSTVMWGHERYETGNRIPLAEVPRQHLPFTISGPSSTHWLRVCTVCTGVVPVQVTVEAATLVTHLGDRVSQETPSSSGSYSLPIPSSEMIPEPWVQELCCRCINQSEERKHDVPRL